MLLDRTVGRPGGILLAVILGLMSASVEAVEHAEALSALNSIRATELKQHVEVLASDQYEGREAGSTGGLAAGDYLAELLQEHQVLGAGDDGGYFQNFGDGYRNVLGWIEGSDPQLKHQTIIVGAHYDHVGYGTSRNSFGPLGQIHNGADDNASGTSGLVEVMQAFCMLPTAPKRSILFAWWDAEEKGMLGSKHWAAHPTEPWENLVCYFNMDMIGRLRDERVEVYGVRTSPRLRELVCRQNLAPQLAIDFVWETKANSDHYPFFRQEIPFLMLHTGVHDDYHRPRDDSEKINADGMQRVARLMFRVVLEMANREDSIEFRSASRYESEATRQQLERPLTDRPPRLGLSWETDDNQSGLFVRSVTVGSAAEQAGIQPGDRITHFDGYPVDNDGRFSMIVLAAASPAEVMVQRGAETESLTLQVPLTGRPVRVGISWRDDSAEPGMVILSQVVHGSAAYLAGLAPGDRIYELDGERFADADEFGQLVTAEVDQLELLVERRGRLSSVQLDLLTRPAQASRESSRAEPALAP